MEALLILAFNLTEKGGAIRGWVLALSGFYYIVGVGGPAVDFKYFFPVKRVLGLFW